MCGNSLFRAGNEIDIQLFEVRNDFQKQVLKILKCCVDYLGILEDVLPIIY